MKKIGLYYFSGTGMTKYIVDALNREFEKQRVSVDCIKIENAHKVNLSGYDALGISYPVHAFNAPQIVINFARRLPKLNGMETFIIHSAGEDSKANYSSSSLLIKTLRKKGCKVFCDRLIKMPSNFAVKHDNTAVKQIIDEANKTIPYIVESIIKRKPHFMKQNHMSKVLAVLLRCEWYGAHVLGKLYYVNKSCVRCGKCVKNCPTNNIVMNEKSVGFKWRCCICMRCIYICPKNAINIRRPFRFIRFNEWYDLEFFK